MAAASELPTPAYEEPLAKYSPPLGLLDTPRTKVDQHVLTITRVEWLNDQMVRLIASAPNLDGYRSNSALDEYVKVFVADPSLGLVPPYDLRTLRHRPPREQVPRSKSYTIRWVNPVLNELAIDFVVHGAPGTVGHWAGIARTRRSLGYLPGPQQDVAIAQCRLLRPSSR
ncbi:siderophore-interacting protein [Glutamicibacter halophytocola]|uniref:siderophore-interacting protein n=1 Tax=Glutamicibacter halophytocola TaxID=1933880 RepID=UPI0032194DAA